MKLVYTERAPCEALRSRVVCVWAAIVGAGSERGSIIFPDGCVDVVWSPGRELWVAGPDTGYKHPPVPHGTLLIGVRFLCGMAASFLSAPASELKDLNVPLSLVSSPGLSRELQPRLEDSRTLGEACTVLEEAISQHFRNSGEPDLFVQQTIVNILQSVIEPAVHDPGSAESLGISSRQLLNRFKTAVGYGPKTLERVARFRYFLRLIQRHSGRSLAHLAAEAGYADQPHLTRECVRLSGFTPGIVVRKVEQVSDLFKTSEFRNPNMDRH